MNDMNDWTYEDIRIAAEGWWVIEPKGDTISFAGVAIDTRALIKDQIFIAFVGDQVNGHTYLQQAVKAGASMCIVTDASMVPSDLGIPVLVVDDALDAITKLATAWRARIGANVIAITGSNGKTTTCRLVHALCAQNGTSYVSQKSFNNQLGVPITILNTPRDVHYLIAEIGTSSPGEIALRSALIKPDIAVITSIGSAHLEELGDRIGVAKEKAAIIQALPDGATAIIPGGVDELEEAIDPIANSLNIIRVDASRVKVVNVGAFNTDFSLDEVPFAVPMLGMHNAMNASMAIEVGRVLGFDDQSIRDGLMKTDLPEMRFDRIEIPTRTDPIVVYNDAYNANPDSMRVALETFDLLKTDSTKTAILAEMLELGDHSDTQHKAMIDGLARYKSIDRFILVGQAFSQAADGQTSDRLQIVDSADDDGMTTIARSIDPGSWVLLKGSRAMKLERVVFILMNQAAANPVKEDHTHA